VYQSTTATLDLTDTQRQTRKRRTNKNLLTCIV